MLGHFELRTTARALNRQLPQLRLTRQDLPKGGEMQARRPVLVLRREAQGYFPDFLRWGLVGSFLDIEPARPLVFLNSEGLAAMPFYSRLFRQNRCLIPLTAFYSALPAVAGRKRELRSYHADGQPLLMAGVFDDHPRLGPTCAALSVEVPVAGRSGQRLPLLLGPEEAAFWLQQYEEFPLDEFSALRAAAPTCPLEHEIIIEPEASPQLAFQFA